MGEVSEDILYGRACADCGVYFIEGDSGERRLVDHGYPVACHDCFRIYGIADAGITDCGKQRALVKTMGA